ncbi:MAG: hypothetical protein DI536_36025 [Archangium gephyra]|uniref:Uncharacterized protein n=1 Tax=Archangium gephyra TaxID=48 RepID=A0A2W5SNQ0_9BACT|nr:MAG: hypothetical protein DI536_36025 [Archangium gephyra]
MKRDQATLALISGELDRELADNAQRQSNALTRASIILAAAGATSAIASGSGALAAAVLAGAATVACLVAMFLWNSKAVILNGDRVGDWIVQKPAVLSERIILDKLKELDRARRDLDLKNRAVAAGIGFSVLAWIVAAITLATD